MDLTHRFTVPTDVEATWAHFQDIAGLAACFPGASLSEADETTFSGSVKVKLGPIALVYNGSGTFVEKDDAAHRFVVDAKGKDKRGNGTAGAKVSLSMESADAGGTDVEVLTDLAITGKPAQFGRGVMQDVSDKLLGQFVTCLEQKLSGEPEPAAVAAAPVGPADAGGTESTVRAVPDAPAPAPTYTSPPTSGSHRGQPAEDDALDLGAAVLPVLVKGYWKEGLAGLGVLALLAWLLSRRS